MTPECWMSIILAHAHPDHIYGLPSLIHHLMMTRRYSSPDGVAG